MEAVQIDENLRIEDVFNYKVNKNIKDSSLLGSMYEAVEKNDRNKIIQLIKEGAPLNYYKKSTPLHHAVKNGDLELVKLLLEYGADVNLTITNGITPLHRAVSCQHIEIVKYLIQNNADVNAETIDYWIPLHSACSNGNLEIIDYLIQNGGDIGAASSSMFCSLLVCLHSRQIGATSLIMKYEPHPKDVWICNDLVLMNRTLIRVVINNFFDPYSMPESAQSAIPKDNKFFIENWFI